jgi:hypothetical protein
MSDPKATSQRRLGAASADIDQQLAGGRVAFPLADLMRQTGLGGTAAKNQLQPTRPVFLSEAHYERDSDPEHAYHARGQAWSAFLNGAAGYGYGAWGVWQFRDPYDPLGETGNDLASSLAWWEALRVEGAGQMNYVRRLVRIPAPR